MTEPTLDAALARYKADPVFACLVDFIMWMVVNRGFSPEDAAAASALGVYKASEIAALTKPAGEPPQ